MKNLKKFEAKAVKNVKAVKGGRDDNGGHMNTDGNDIVNPLANDEVPIDIGELE